MDDTPSLFDGLQRQQDGIQRTSVTNAEYLEEARRVAVQIALSDPNHEVDAERVRFRMDVREKYPETSAAYGAILRGCPAEGKRFVNTGRTRQSNRPSANGRRIFIHRLEPITSG